MYDPQLLEQRGHASQDGGSEGGSPDGGAGDPDAGPGCLVQAQGALEYHFCPRELTWEEARAACQSLGGDLAQIRDATEAGRVTRDLSSVSWVGLQRIEAGDVWIWAASGVPVWQGDTSGSPVAGRYANWEEGQPGTPGACGRVTTEGTFETADCSMRNPYVCEVAPDGCPGEPDKTEPGQCGCDEPDTDADGDAFAACNDSCDDDASKLVPGVCGCGIPDIDDDGDGEVDCDDYCPDDPDKNAPGVCGCGVADTDTDGDNKPDCTDACPDDPGKLEPGICGCGTPDLDSDGDGTSDCSDGCPSDPDKTQDGDGDADGAPDCVDGCPSDPGVTSSCLPFTPTNIDTTPLDFSGSPDAVLDGCGSGTTTITTSTSGGTFDNWCGSPPATHVQSQGGGPDLVVIPLQGLTVSGGHTLRLLGSQPVAFVVRGAVTVDGAIDASGDGTVPGAGGNRMCSGSRGGDGSGNTDRWDGASGGGGGGFGTQGGSGGVADTDDNRVPGGSPGDRRGNEGLSPLLGGCAGGRAGDCSTPGGGGGGAVQITAADTMRIRGTLRANGGHGARPCGGSDEGGGTGGGSGGAILIEATDVDMSGGGTLQANGGDGGRNGEYAGIYDCGGTSGGGGSTSPKVSGVTPAGCQGGGPGGGGGYGRRLVSFR